jgi:hypothetical protein
MKITSASDAYYAQLVARQKAPTAATNVEKSEPVAVIAAQPSNPNSVGYAAKPSTAMLAKIREALEVYSNEVHRIRESNVDNKTKDVELRAAAKEINVQVNEYRAVEAHTNDMVVDTSGIAYGRRVYLFGAVNQFGAVNGMPIKIAKLGPKEEADIAQKNPDPAAFAAAYEKRRLEIENKINTTKSRDMHFSNILELPLEVARKAIDIVQTKIENHEDAGMNIRAHIGNQVVSDLNIYLAALKDFVSKHEASEPSTTTGLASETTTDAAVSDVVPKEQLRNSASVAFSFSTALDRLRNLGEAHANAVQLIQESNVDHVTKAAELRAATDEYNAQAQEPRAALRKMMEAARGDIAVTGVNLVKVVGRTDVQAAEQKQAYAAALEVDHAKAMQEPEKSKHLEESHEMYLPNIADLSLENAKKSLGIAEGMIRNHDDAGINVHGRYGDQDISDLHTYLAALKDFISQREAAVPLATSEPATGTPTGPTTTAPSPYVDPVGLPGQNHIYLPNIISLSSTTAASVYRQVQDMVSRNGVEGSVLHARNGEAGTSSIDTYLSWLALRAGISIDT